MHWSWNDILTVTYCLLTGFSVAIVFYVIGYTRGWIKSRIRAETILTDEITRMRREYGDNAALDGYDENESLHTVIRVQTIKDCMRLI